MSYTYANNVRAALGAAVGVGDVTLTISAAVAPFNPPPAASVLVPARLTIVDSLYAPTKVEIVTYTGRTGAGPYTLTGVTRAQESTTAQAFTTGYVYQSATAADFSAFSALTDLTPIGVLGTGSDTAFDSTDALTVTHSTLSSDSRFKRVGSVYEYTAGSSATDSTMDFDYADILNYTRDVETPNATITPSATTNTYQDYVFGTGTVATNTIGRTTSTRYKNAYQVFRGPCAATGFTVYLGANTNTPTGSINYALIKFPIGNKYATWSGCQVITSGAFTPSASATNTITFSSAQYLDDSFYAVVLYVASAQDGDSDYYAVGSHAATVVNAYGSTIDYAPTANTLDAPPVILTAENAQVVMTLTSGKINAGVALTISGDYWYPSDIGKTVRGNSGHFLITGLTDLCTGGTALAGAGTAANAFDGDLVGTSTAASTNGYVGYDFGSSKTIRGVSVMFADASYDRILDLVIEVSDDNFTGSTTVVNPSARGYQNRCWYYWDITSPTSGRYIRIRETGGAALTVMEMECYDGTTALAHLNLAAFANTNAITSGNWTLEGTGWNNGWVSGEVSSGLITSTSTSSFASIDGVASALIYGGPQFVNRGSYASDSALNGSWYATSKKVAYLGSDKFVMIYGANSNADAYAVVVSVASDGAVTFGSPTAFILGGSYLADYSDVCVISSSLFVIGHKQTLWACTVSGTTIAIGTGVSNTANTNTSGMPCIAAVDSTRFVCTGSLATSTYHASVAGSISGTTITLGSKVDLTATAYNGDGYGSPCVLVDTDKVLAAYITTGTTTTIRAKILSLTGTSISAGSEATGTWVFGYMGSKAIGLAGANKILLTAATSAAASVKHTAIAATVSGTTITFGTAANIAFISGISGVGGGTPKFISATSSLAYIGNISYIAPLSLSGASITVGSLVPNIGGFADPVNAVVGGSYAVLVGDGFVAARRAIVHVLMITAQANLLVGPALAVSFNGTTYSIWNGSAARAIASSLTSVHGGTDGTWYYLDSASVWTAASSSTALQALKQAQAYSANCMSVDEMKQMTSANWTTMGVTEANPTTYFGFTWQSDNTRYLMPYDLDKLSLTYTSRARWDQATQNYVINMGSETGATITKSTAGTASIKAVIIGPAT